MFTFKFSNNLLPANINNYYKSVKKVRNECHTRSSETNFFLPIFNSKIGINRYLTEVVSYGLSYYYV